MASRDFQSLRARRIVIDDTWMRTVPDHTIQSVVCGSRLPIILTESLGKVVIITGFNTCTRWGDAEDADSIQVNE
jgi:hypothetical protein